MAKAKTLKSRFKNQATQLANQGTTKSGKTLTNKMIENRALRRATRHADAASKNTNRRAFSTSTSRKATVSTATKKTIGRGVRTARTAAGQNIGSGKKQTALKTGRKAIKTSVRRGTVSASAGSKALNTLMRVDPSTRRAIVGASGTRASKKSSFGSGGLKNRQGKDLSLMTKGIRRSARKAGASSKIDKAVKTNDAKVAAKKAAGRSRRGGV